MSLFLWDSPYYSSTVVYWMKSINKSKCSTSVAFLHGLPFWYTYLYWQHTCILIGESKYFKKECYDFMFQLTNQNAEFDILLLPIMNCSRLGNATNVIHFNLLLFRPIYYSVSTRKWKSIGIGNSTMYISCFILFNNSNL